MAGYTVWHGTNKQMDALRTAVEGNCTCNRDDPTGPACPTHKVLSDQRLLDHLAFARHMRGKWLASEFKEDHNTAA